MAANLVDDDAFRIGEGTMATPSFTLIVQVHSRFSTNLGVDDDFTIDQTAVAVRFAATNGDYIAKSSSCFSMMVSIRKTEFRIVPRQNS
jgi:hypothetical protein